MLPCGPFRALDLRWSGAFSWPSGGWSLVRSINRDAYLTRAEAVLYLRVSRHTVGKWQARGWLTPEGERRYLSARRRNGRDLEYRLGDLLDAEKHTFRSGRSRRRPVWADMVCQPGQEPSPSPQVRCAGDAGCGDDAAGPPGVEQFGSSAAS